MIELSPEAGRLIKSMYERIHALMAENHYLRSQLLTKETTLNIKGLVDDSGCCGQAPEGLLVDIEDLAGPFLGLNMEAIEPGHVEDVSDQVLQSVFGNAL